MDKIYYAIMLKIYNDENTGSEYSMDIELYRSDNYSELANYYKNFTTDYKVSNYLVDLLSNFDNPIFSARIVRISPMSDWSVPSVIVKK